MDNGIIPSLLIFLTKYLNTPLVPYESFQTILLF